MVQHYILYQATGGIDYINECRYALLQYLSVYNLKPPANVSVVVYTNQPASFEAFDPFFQHFSLEETGPAPLPKCDLIHRFAQSHTGNFICADVDTYLKQPVEPIFHLLQKTDALFYKKESFQNKNKWVQFQKLKEFLSANQVQVQGQRIRYPEQRNFYTTHTVAFRSDALDKIVGIRELQSKLEKNFPQPIAEEFSFSYFCQGNGNDLQNYFVSFRNFPEFKKLLKSFFLKNEEESIPNLVKLIHHIDAQAIFQEKKRFDCLPIVKKLLYTLTGKAWSLRQYQNKF